MAVVNLKSTVISNRDATPKVLTDGLVAAGESSGCEGFVTCGTADSIASTYRLCQVPSNARVDSVRISNAALTSGVVSVGVYYPTFIPVGATLTPALASTAISSALFASALSVASAASETAITNQSGTNTIALQEQALWQAAGLTADPGLPLDIVVTVTTALTAGGLLGLKVNYQF